MFIARRFAPRSLQSRPFFLLATRTCFALNRGGIMELSVIDGKITEKKVFMVSKTYCPFCTKAKKAFKELLDAGDLKKDDYEVVEIENDSNCEKIQAHMLKKTGGRSVPRVFIKGKFFGGGDDVAQAYSNGSLAKMVKD